MSPQDETLSPQQMRVVVAIVLLTIIVFSSVFIYADWKGAQVRKMRIGLLNTQLKERARNRNFRGLNLEAIKSRATPIVRGTSKQNTSGKFPAGRAWSHYWAISKFPPYSGNGSMPMPQLCAYSYSDSEWNISPAYVVTVPFNAELGLYIAHYHVNQYGRDYFFEVVDGAMVPQDVHFSATELSSSEAWEHNRRFQTSGIWSDISVALARATSDSCKSPQAAQLAAE